MKVEETKETPIKFLRGILCCVGTYDIRNSISAILCDIFIINDISFAEEFHAVFLI